jgi:ABC-type Fe3+-hydroxamate transport system substrate-binding protein
MRMNERLFSAGPPAFPHQRMRALLFLAALCLPALSVQGCAERAPMRGDRPPPQRIVSLVPSATEILLAIGAADRIVGRTAYDTDLRLAAVFSFGRTMHASTEAILALEPDLVIDASYARWSGPLTLLAGEHIATVTTDVQTYQDILALIDTLGALVDESRRAAALRGDLERDAEQLRQSAPANPPSALYLVWHDPPRTISRHSYLNDVVELAGARNAFADLRQEWPEISLEIILRRDPDYIILAADDGATVERLRLRPGWRELSAVRSGHLIEVPASLFHRPGPRVIDAARWLRAALQHSSGGT